MSSHKIQLVGQRELPEGQDWAFVEHDDRTTLFIKEHALTPAKLEEAWEAYRLLVARPPRPRMALESRVRIRSEVGRLRAMTALLLAGYGITAMKVGSAIL